MNVLFPALCWLVLTAGVLVSCTRKPKPTPPPPVEKVNGQEVAKADDGAAAAKDPNETLFDFGFVPGTRTWTVYFDFDQFGIREPEKVAAAVAYLKAHPGSRVTLNGHTCPRGTNAYNLALGARRAQAVRAYIEASGIDDMRVSWQSFGEEQLAQHDPEKWALNRRCEIIVEASK